MGPSERVGWKVTARDVPIVAHRSKGSWRICERALTLGPSRIVVSERSHLSVKTAFSPKNCDRNGYSACKLLSVNDFCGPALLPRRSRAAGGGGQFPAGASSHRAAWRGQAAHCPLGGSGGALR